MDACINVIERFMSQYADITIALYSDNGMNFRGTDNAIKRMFKKNTHQKFKRYYRPKKITWHFNTPLASTQGGAWERLIRSVRKLLSHLPCDPQTFPVTIDNLRTMQAGAQKIINTRPLTPVRAIPDDCDAITPSSLLHHQSVKPTNPLWALSSCESPLKNHRHVQERVDIFWKEWMHLYMPYLQKRHAQRILQKNLRLETFFFCLTNPLPGTSTHWPE